jgi:hypothetical protein
MQSNRLLVFRSFAHDSQSGLAGVLGRLSGLVGFAQMFRECRIYGWLYVARERITANRATFRVAIQDPMRWKICTLLRSHADSLRRPCFHSSPVEIKRHHYS